MAPIGSSWQSVTPSFGVWVLLAACSHATTLPNLGDIVHALSVGDLDNSITLVRGPAVAGGGAVEPSYWQQRVTDVVLDNIDGKQSNANGNLLGVNFNGEVYSLSTTSTANGSGQLISTSTNYTAGGLTDIDVSPNNQAVAMAAILGGAVVFADYTSGDTRGSGASLSNFREAGVLFDPVAAGVGVAWLPDQEALVFGANGELFTIDADTLQKSVLADLGLDPAFTENTTVVDEPQISQLVFAAKSVFVGGNVSNTICVFDLASPGSPVNTVEAIGPAAFDYGAATASRSMSTG